MGHNVAVTCPIPQPGLDLLHQACETVDVGPTERLPRPEDLQRLVAGRDGVLCSIGDPVDRAVLAAAGRRCRVFANFGVGTDHIDLIAARELDIVVTNTPGVLTDATADLTWALILAVARRVAEGDRLVRARRWPGWSPTSMIGSDVTGRTLGIVGAGRIGTAVGLRAGAFRMTLLYVARRANSELDAQGARRVDLDDLLRESDFVTLHVPLSNETRHLIGVDQLKLMKREAFLINTARGAIVDQPALIGALREGRIAGAGLDVYQDEPYVSSSLLELDNVVCLPHLGSAARGTRNRMAEMVATDLLRVLDGQPPRHRVI